MVALSTILVVASNKEWSIAEDLGENMTLGLAFERNLAKEMESN